jgi:2-dehydro-3-deoxygluconokinase
VIRIASIGECMTEFTRADARTFQLSFAGDCYNTAVYLQRLGAAHVAVDFLTATGDDWLSDMLLDAVASEGIRARAVRVPGASPALYIVSTNESGERSFAYFRDGSPVRSLFGEDRDALLETLPDYDLIYFSAITLQMLSREARGRLLDALRAARNTGTLVAFDSNFRSKGWPSLAEAAREIERAMAVTDIALPSRSDEGALHIDSEVDDVIRRYAQAGAIEVVVKDGPAKVASWVSGVRGEWATEEDERPLDTTGAGDSFNAGYLVARLLGNSVESSVRLGQDVARLVIGAPGAIVDPGKFAGSGLAAAPNYSKPSP